MESIVFEGVHKIFRRNRVWFSTKRGMETHALKSISLTIRAGEVLGLLGPNGSGKSTTLKLISTVLLPDRGRVTVQGCETRDQGHAVRKTVGFALTTERSFFPRLTVRENLDFFAALEDVPRREISGRIADVLARVGLNDAKNKQVMKLSSGMHQRLGIARALIKRPSVVLLDEPSRSLDTEGTEELRNWIRELSGDGMTVVVASHNFEEATAICDRVALIRRGELMDCKSTQGLRPEHLRELYLEMTTEKRRDSFVLEVPA
jgi:ABC-2 type transport system ATP-binding protein